uniref:AlNc14C259G9783 protein n=1 Tax=Albugo laibachii Nc14 TaxID=890382 RepID=F0WTV8_9STRA|nr:AlNc14C259G9783 [Albugo laibachii Nc14]CCA26866.1 AlNc14C424G11548 [Albugo laibachii Nc14]|eukprot:CCA26866.1 AlNc14C424G11548 [Albugo laibachii Nc14]
MATKASPQESPRLDSVGRHVQQYSMNEETVFKKLNVLDVIETTKDLRDTIMLLSEHNRRHLQAEVDTYLLLKKAQRKLRNATQANKGGHRKIRYKVTVTLLRYDLENVIVRFVNEFRKEVVPVSAAMLMIQAK